MTTRIFNRADELLSVRRELDFIDSRLAELEIFALPYVEARVDRIVAGAMELYRRNGQYRRNR